MKKPRKANPRKVDLTGGSSVKTERTGIQVRFRGPTGRFVKPPKSAPETGLTPEQERARLGIVEQITGNRSYYRDTATGRFASKKQAIPDVIIIGRGKRARVLRPTTKAERVAAIAINKAEELEQSATTASRMLEDNAISGRGNFVKTGGRYFKIAPEQAGAMAQLVRLLNARYFATFRDLLPSPWLQFGTVEMSNADLLDLDTFNLLPPELAELMEGDRELEDAALDFVTFKNDTVSTYLKVQKNAPKKATKAKPTARKR